MSLNSTQGHNLEASQCCLYLISFVLAFLTVGLGTQLSSAGPFDPAKDPERGLDDSRFQTSYEDAKQLHDIELDIEELKLLEFMYSAESYIDEIGCLKHLNALTELNNESNQLDKATYQKQKQALDQRRQQIKRDYKQCFDGLLQSRWFTHLNPYGVQTWEAFIARKKMITAKFATSGTVQQENMALKIKEYDDKHAREISRELNKNYGVIAKVRKPFGRVEHLTEEGWKTASKNEPLRVNSELRTGPRGRARIEFLDFNLSNAGPTVVNMGTNSHIIIEKLRFDFPESFGQVGEQTSRYSVMNLISGAIRAVTRGWMSTSGFSVRAGTTVCGIRGTEIGIDYHPDQNPDRVRYRLFHGDAYVETPAGQIPLKPGYETVVTRGQLSKPIPIPPKSRTPREDRPPT